MRALARDGDDTGARTARSHGTGRRHGPPLADTRCARRTGGDAVANRRGRWNPAGRSDRPSWPSQSTHGRRHDDEEVLKRVDRAAEDVASARDGRSSRVHQHSARSGTSHRTSCGRRRVPQALPARPLRPAWRARPPGRRRPSHAAADRDRAEQARGDRAGRRHLVSPATAAARAHVIGEHAAGLLRPSPLGGVSRSGC